MTGPAAGLQVEAERAAVQERDREQALRGAGTNFLALLGGTALLAFQALGARLFGPAIWGLYAFGISILDLGLRIGLASADKGMLVFVAARRAEGDERGVYRAMATGIRVSLAVGVVLAAGLMAASWLVGDAYGEPGFGRALRWLAPAIPLTNLTIILIAATMATKTVRYNLYVKGITEPALFISLVIVFGLLVGGLGGLAAVHLIAVACTMLVALWSFTRCLDARRMLRALRRAPFDGALVRYSVPLALAEFVNIAVYRVDILLLGMFRPVEEVGIYAACVLLGASVSFIRGAFDAVVAPRAAEAWAQRDHERLATDLKVHSRMVLLFALALGAFFIIAGPALLALFGPTFVRGATTLQWLTAGHVVNASLGLAGWVLLAGKRSGLVLANAAVMLGVNTVLCLLLIPRYGMQGAAMATVFAIALLHLVQSLQAHVIARAQPVSAGFLRVAFIGVSIIALEVLAYRALGGSALLRAVSLTVVATPLYFFLVWLFGSPAERSALAALLRRNEPKR